MSGARAAVDEPLHAAAAIHRPQSQWADALRELALSDPAPVDAGTLIENYRARYPWYAQRLHQVTRWEEIVPLEKSEIAAIPVSAATALGEQRSSGTSGFQVTIRNTAREREFRRALLYRPQLFYGLPEKVHQLVFVDGNWCAGPDDPPKWFRYGGVDYLTWFAGVAADCGAILRLLRAIRPQLIRGISSGIVRFIEQADVSLRGLDTQVVAPGGEFLLPQWRATIETAFGVPVLDRYGSQETGALAWQCPFCQRYHANADQTVIEAGADGLLATPLFIESQPLLRYRLGDQVSLHDAAADCRIRLPVLRIQQARRDDWIVAADGQRISPLAFQFEQIAGLQAWRLHQQSDGALRLYFDAAEPAAVTAELARRLTDIVPDRPFELVEGIWQCARGGKFKRVSSELVAG